MLICANMNCTGFESLEAQEMIGTHREGVAGLAASLTELVDRMQVDWDQQRIIRPESLEQTHELLHLAERLLTPSE